MVLKELKLLQFRKYNHRVFQFSPNINFITGKNGSGKTSILEAIYYLALTKSFRTNLDSEVVMSGENFFQLFGTFVGANQTVKNVNLNYLKSEGKRLIIDKNLTIKKSDHVGTIPLVILSPDSINVTSGTQSERRIFIDRLLSQAFRDYLDALVDYRRRLTARNRALEKYSSEGKKRYDIYFETQDELLVKQADIIYTRRKEFSVAFSPILSDCFRRFAHVEKGMNLLIIPDIKTGDGENFKDCYLKILRERFPKDLVLGRTIRGAHQDEVKILLGEKDIRYFGSQGEHKIAQVALTFAEGQYLEQIKSEPIIYLLDDLFAYLDQQHCERVMQHLSRKNQVLVTTTELAAAMEEGLKRSKNSLNVISLEEAQA